MGLFSSKKKKKNKKNENIAEPYDTMTLEEALSRSIHASFMDKPDHGDTVLTEAYENIEHLRNLQKSLEEAKYEYESVTVYLTDIQKIDALPPNDRTEVEDYARKIVHLNNERKKHQDNKKSVNDPEYQLIRRYEDKIQEEINHIEEQESYQQLVKNDLKHLEGERGTILYEKETALQKREFVKKFSMGISILACSIFILLFAVSEQTKSSLSVPFLLLGCMAAAAAAYVITVLRDAAVTSKQADLKLNKLIQIVNKVKIKYVNTVSILDFLYEKYHINSSRELAYLWEQYSLVKEEAKQHKQNTEMLETYHRLLVDKLLDIDVKDADSWIYQPEALFDEREMVEVRHRLNIRRQRLRERMEKLQNQMENYRGELAGFRKRHPEHEEAIAGIMHF